jgi:hypothetical protein
MFCALVLVFGGAECVGSRFHDLPTRTRFRRYRGRPIPFSCSPLPDMFLAGRRVSCLVFMFCVPGQVFCGTEGVGSRFHVCTAGLIFGGTEGVDSHFHVFSFPNSFSAVRRVSGPVFIFCAPELVFGGCLPLKDIKDE